jgi:hypothetical protein
VFSGTASGLHTEALSECFELMRSECVGQEWKQDHCRSSESSAEVRRTCVDVAEVFIELVTGALFLEELFDSLDALAPALEDGDDVSSFLHRDNAHVVFFVDPDEEFAAVSTEDAAVVGPVSASACCSKERRAGRFLEEVAIAAELVGHGLGHGGEVGLLTFEFAVAVEAFEARFELGLHFGTVFRVGESRKGEPLDGAASADSSGLDLLVDGFYRNRERR